MPWRIWAWQNYRRFWSVGKFETPSVKPTAYTRADLAEQMAAALRNCQKALQEEDLRLILEADDICTSALAAYKAMQND